MQVEGCADQKALNALNRSLEPAAIRQKITQWERKQAAIAERRKEGKPKAWKPTLPPDFMSAMAAMNMEQAT